jgi:flavin-dependent dehydrogenase
VSQTDFDIIIVGAGPAGTSTGLHLLRHDPGWAGRLLLLDKARYPRPKLCGGGLTEWGARELDKLGLTLEVPNVKVRQARFVFEDICFSVWGPPVFYITRRDELDAWLLARVREHGAAVHEGETVLDLAVEAGAVRVQTSAGDYCARAVVGADGSKGIVRRVALAGERHGRMAEKAAAVQPGPGAPPGVARLLEVLTAEDPARTPEYLDGTAVFDFSPIAGGVQGYYWDFPSYVKGRAFMNRGVYDSRAAPAAPRASLKPALAAALAGRGRSLDEVELHGHPIRWFNPASQFSRPRVLLAGDAAGVDPLFGEGIGYALAYGRVAAGALRRAFATGDFSFRSYRRQILADWLGRDLTFRYACARAAYGLLSSRRRARLAVRLARAAVPLIPWANRGKP